MRSISRRTFIALLAATFAPRPANGQPVRRTWRIGYLNPGSSALAPIRLDPLRDGLREVGYVEGKGVVIEARWAEGDFARLPALAAELVQLNVDVIVTAGGSAAQAAKGATVTIPIVMVDPGDPVGSGLIKTLARPGGNITGLSSAARDLVAKQVQLLREAIPQLAVVGFLTGNTAAAALAMKDAQEAAEGLGMRFQVLEVRGPSDLEAAFQALPRDRRRAVLVFPDPLTFSHRRRIMEVAEQDHAPSVAGSREFVDAGGLMSYGPSFPAMFRQAAMYVSKILKGAKPADLPVEQPTKFELVINLKTAKTLGLTIPQSLLLRADEVIE